MGKKDVKQHYNNSSSCNSRTNGIQVTRPSLPIQYSKKIRLFHNFHSSHYYVHYIS